MSSSKLELPGILKKSISALSQDEASANESVFANAMAMMAQGKFSTSGFAPYPPSNEAVFANPATTLFAPGKLGSNGLSVPQPPSIMKKTNSSRSQEPDIPHITVSLRTCCPSNRTHDHREGQEGQERTTKCSSSLLSPSPSPSLKSLTSTRSPLQRRLLGRSSGHREERSGSSVRIRVCIQVQCFRYGRSGTMMLPQAMTQAPSWGNVTTKKTIPAGKKGRSVTISEEPDVEADPIVSPPSFSAAKTTKGAWGSVNVKSKFAPTIVEENEPEPAPTPPVTSAGSKKTTKTPTPAKSPWTKQQAQATFVLEEQVSEVEPAPAPSRTNERGTKSRGPQAEPRRGTETSVSKSVRVETVPDPEDDWAEISAGGSSMPGTLEFDGEKDAEDEDEEDGGASAWFDQENINYWANFIGSQSEAQAQEAPEATEKVGKHVRWTPTVDEDSDEEEEFGAVDEDLDDPVWLQYAVSGGDIPSPESAPAEPRVTLSDNAQRGPNLWEQGSGKKKSVQSNGDIGNRAQQTPVFDRAAFPGGQWPKMENWLSSAPRVGQSSGSARFF
ncbi:hypothetical protein BU15DRAFT_74678 [Melanogaster broomeanus]|nr:hypothetical protein BU15DRAFT_74678 [Melanogaster broomeanus]